MRCLGLRAAIPKPKDPPICVQPDPETRGRLRPRLIWLTRGMNKPRLYDQPLTFYKKSCSRAGRRESDDLACRRISNRLDSRTGTQSNASWTAVLIGARDISRELFSRAWWTI